MRYTIPALLSAFLLFLGSCREQAPPPGTPSAEPTQVPLQRVRLLLNWTPEVEHGGFYAALVNGFYREEGLDVEILPGGVDAPVAARVDTGAVEFGVLNADRLAQARSGGATVIALMAPLQESPRCIMVHEETGITSLADLRDLTLAMSASASFSHFIRKNYPLENVRIVPYTGTVAQFLEDRRYAQQGYNFSEPFVARRQGARPVVLMVSEAGFNPYTSLLITSETLADKNPDLMLRMVRASIRGWKSYIENPVPANAHINKVNPEMPLDILAYGADVLKPMTVSPDTERLGSGTMTMERWQTLIQQLEELDQVNRDTVRASEIFRPDYLNQVAK